MWNWDSLNFAIISWNHFQTLHHLEWEWWEKTFNVTSQYLREGLKKNAGHDIAIVGEPCNADAHAEIPTLFMPMLCPRLRNMSSSVCASSMFSCLCLKMLSSMFVRAWAMPRILYLSCGIPFLVWTPGIIFGLTLVVVWLSWWDFR